MQEGMFSLMQMAKTSQAIGKHREKGLLSICVMTDPTTGGVSASFASLGDVIIGEKGALIGFAGPRVISQVTGTILPDGFQRADFLLEHGLLDMVVAREDMKYTLAKLLDIFVPEKQSDKQAEKKKTKTERTEPRLTYFVIKTIRIKKHKSPRVYKGDKAINNAPVQATPFPPFTPGRIGKLCPRIAPIPVSIKIKVFWSSFPGFQNKIIRKIGTIHFAISIKSTVMPALFPSVRKTLVLPGFPEP